MIINYIYHIGQEHLTICRKFGKGRVKQTRASARTASTICCMTTGITAITLMKHRGNKCKLKYVPFVHSSCIHLFIQYCQYHYTVPQRTCTACKMRIFHCINMCMSYYKKKIYIFFFFLYLYLLHLLFKIAQDNIQVEYVLPVLSVQSLTSLTVRLALLHVKGLVPDGILAGCTLETLDVVRHLQGMHNFLVKGEKYKQMCFIF